METQRMSLRKRLIIAAIPLTLLVVLVIMIVYKVGDVVSSFVCDPPYEYEYYGDDADTSMLIIRQWFAYGYIDTKGKVVIRPQFSEANPFYDGMAVVKSCGKYGYVDKSGKVVISPQFDEANRFYDGLAVVKRNGKYGYVDKSGKMAIRPQFNEAWAFSDGFAVVQFNGKYGYIDKAGKIVIQLQYSAAGGFYNGNAFVGTDVKKVNDTTNAYNSFIIDVHGNVVRELGYIQWCSLGEVNIISHENGSQAIVDKNFNETLQLPDTAVVWGYHDGLARISLFGPYNDDNNEYYINQSGLKAFPDIFITAQDFSEGLAAVRRNNEAGWEYIDTKGRVVISQKYWDAYPFGDGVAWVRDSEWVMIDKLGNQKGTLKKPEGEVILCEPVGSFSDGLCVVKVRYNGPHPMRDYYGYVNTSGEWVIQPKFYKASPFRNGVAEVWVGDKLAYIDKTGKYIWGPK